MCSGQHFRLFKIIVYVCRGCAHTWVCVCTNACGGSRSTLSLSLHLLLIRSVWGGVFCRARRSRAGWPVSRALPASIVPALGLPDVCHRAWFCWFTLVLGIPMQVLVLARSALPFRHPHNSQCMHVCTQGAYLCTYVKVSSSGSLHGTFWDGVCLGTSRDPPGSSSSWGHMHHCTQPLHWCWNAQQAL